MNDPEILATMDVLREFGFEPKGTSNFGFEQTLVFDFGNFQLDANLGMNQWFRQVVFITGNLVTPRTMEMIDFQIPTHIASRELCAAFIAYYLKGSGVGEGDTTRGADWLSQGRLQSDLLSWRRHQLAYEARRVCEVGRAWLRLALKTLADQLVSVDDETLVLIGFKDGTLSIQGPGDKMVLPANGTSWPQQVTIPAGSLRPLAKRLMSDPVSVSIWESCLIIDRRRYPGVVDMPKPG